MIIANSLQERDQILKEVAAVLSTPGPDGTWIIYETVEEVPPEYQWVFAPPTPEPTVKIWPTIQLFYDEFDLATELGPIMVAYQTNADVNLIPLIKYLESCRDGLRADHVKMQAGMAYLVAAGYLTQARSDAIMGVTP